MFWKKAAQESQTPMPSVIRRLQLEVETLAASAESSQIRSALNEFARDLRFSDPVSHSDLGDIEGRLEDCVQLLRQTLEEGVQDQFMPRLEKAKRVLNERNLQCRATKR